jgi:formylglycine-generating enzyme required for sulfatase activity
MRSFTHAIRTVSVSLVLFCLPEAVAIAEHPAPLPVPDSVATTEAEMKPYAELIEHTKTKIQMLPIPGGTFLMGSPRRETGRGKDEGPQHEVTLSPFWMASHEITWNAYEVWMSDTDILRREVLSIKATQRDALADEFQLSKPTPPYTDMTFGMGKRGYPAICMTQHAARTFCQWLTAKTGRYYRLPTEAEWEYACRAGTTTAYHFGDDPATLSQYAWFYDNSPDRYQLVGKKKPNPWGLYDMHGNVSEWVLDQHLVTGYLTHEPKSPLAIPATLYPRVVRGGSWDDDPERLRSAARRGSEEEWKEQDPQDPVSIWYHTDARWVGFRIIRPLVEPTDKEKAEKWDKTAPLQIDPIE